jgi:hypothetical protein
VQIAKAFKAGIIHTALLKKVKSLRDLLSLKLKTSDFAIFFFLQVLKVFQILTSRFILSAFLALAFSPSVVLSNCLGGGVL